MTKISYCGDGDFAKIKAIKEVMLKNRPDKAQIELVINSALLPVNFNQERQYFGGVEIIKEIYLSEGEVWCNFLQTKRKNAKIWRCLFTDTALWYQTLQKYS